MRWAMMLSILLCEIACGAQWIAPDWHGSEPNFPPGSLFWMTNKFRSCPILYRTVVRVRRKRIAFAAVRLHARGYIYVFMTRNGRNSDLDPFGKLIGRAEAPPGQGDAPVTLTVDLTPHVSPGQTFALVVSAPLDGFDMDGLIAFDDGSIQPLVTQRDGWRVQKFAPLTMLEFEPCMRVNFDDGDWFPVRIMGGSVMSAEQLQKLRNDLHRFYKDAVRERLRRELDVVRWRLQLLRTKGIVIVDGEAFTWAGEARLPRWLREIASKLTLQCDDTANALNAGDTASASALITALEALSLFVWVNDDLVNVRNHATAWELLRDRQRASQCASATRAIERALQRAGEHIRMGRWSDALSLLRTARQRLLSLRGRGGKVLQAPIVNELNYGLENKFGWFDFTGFLDNNPTNWGLELAPRQVTSRIELNGIWQFRTDPQNVGMKRNWHKGAFGKAERTLKVPGSWESQGVTQVNPLHIKQHPFPGINVGADVPYNGWAWYWRFVHIPKEWAGHDLELIVHGIDDFDWTYWNGELIGHTGAKVPNFWRTTRRYRIPKRIVRFGDSNLLIVRIYDCRGYGGIIGDAELQCIGWQARHSTPAVATPDVLVSPLSIAVWVELNDDTLWLSGWRKMGEQLPQELLCIIGDKVRRLPLRNVAYDMQRDGRLSECWLALIAKGAPSKSLLIVLECNPTRIVADDATIRITFNRRHASVLLLRPFHDGKVNAERCRLWARIAIAYPIAFTEVPFKVGAKLRIITCYNYRILRNEWNAKPLKVAPVPPLLTLALKVAHRGVRIITQVKRLPFIMRIVNAPLQVAFNRETLVYEIPIVPIIRHGGFTSFCFSPVDIGVPGNVKELETIKRAGANSFRPQHNRRDDAAMRLVRLCMKLGIAHVFNPDEHFAKKVDIVAHYRQLAHLCKDLPPDAIAYDLINEPAHMSPEFYNPLVKRITRAIREVDRTHLIYIETPASYASVDQFKALEPTGDSRTVYSFHSYDFRLPPRYPNERMDIRTMLQRWLPAMLFSVQHGVTIHLGEFGGFEQTRNDPFTNPSTVTLLMDYFRIFDRFGWHFHYYANRGIVRVRRDGSLQESLVQEAYRRYFARKTLNAVRMHAR